MRPSPAAGSSHLPITAKGASLYTGQATPEGKGAAALKAPSNTPATPAPPADARDTRSPDQRRAQQHAAAAPSAIQAASDPTSSIALRLRAAGGSPGASGLPAVARDALADAPAAASAPVSHGSRSSPISFGSQCTPAPAPVGFGSPQGSPSTSRAIDFGAAVASPGAASTRSLLGPQGGGNYTPHTIVAAAFAAPHAGAQRAAPAAGGQGDAAVGEPAPLEQLLAELQDPASRASFEELFMGAGGSTGASGAAALGAAAAGGGGRGGRGEARDGAAAAPGRGAGWRLLAVMLLLGGAAAAALHAAGPWGPPAPPAPCGGRDLASCAKAYGDYFAAAAAALDAPPPSGWRALALHAKWRAHDAWAMLREGRAPGSELPSEVVVPTDLVSRAEEFVRAARLAAALAAEHAPPAAEAAETVAGQAPAAAPAGGAMEEAPAADGSDAQLGAEPRALESEPAVQEPEPAAHTHPAGPEPRPTPRVAEPPAAGDAALPEDVEEPAAAAREELPASENAVPQPLAAEPHAAEVQPAAPPHVAAEGEAATSAADEPVAAEAEEGASGGEQLADSYQEGGSGAEALLAAEGQAVRGSFLQVGLWVMGSALGCACWGLLPGCWSAL